MIIDLQKFVMTERPYWAELEAILDQLEAEPMMVMDLTQLKHFHYLYDRTSADLARIVTFSTEPEMPRYLENLVARAYGEIHETRGKQKRFSIGQWFFQTLPQTFRRRARAFLLALSITMVGGAFGGLALALDPEAKGVLMPFSHLQGDPAERVAREERAAADRLQGTKSTFSSFLMTHNTKVAILAMALGMTWGVGTIILLFYNGVILGAVVVDYVVAGQAKFLLGWLLPHGAFEIPAILIAGQAGLVLANALIGWGQRTSLRMRLRSIAGDLVTLIAGVALFLVWAGFVEAFLSQSHEPVIPYGVKIGFGITELFLLILFLGTCGTKHRGAPLRDSSPDLVDRS